MVGFFSQFDFFAQAEKEEMLFQERLRWVGWPAELRLVD